MRDLRTGHWSLVTGHSPLATRYSLLATRYSSGEAQGVQQFGPRRSEADRETDVALVVAEGAAIHAGDAGLLKQREGIFPGAQLAPVIDGGVVVEADGFKEVELRVELLQLVAQRPAAQGIECPHLILDPGPLVEQVDVRQV